jgi:hypothetical protein
MPTVNPPVVALVLALDPVLAEGALLDEGGLLYGGGADAPPDEGALLGAARAVPAMSATLAAAVKRSAGRIEVSLSVPLRSSETVVCYDRSEKCSLRPIRPRSAEAGYGYGETLRNLDVVALAERRLNKRAPCAGGAR